MTNLELEQTVAHFMQSDIIQHIRDKNSDHVGSNM